MLSLHVPVCIAWGARAFWRTARSGVHAHAPAECMRTLQQACPLCGAVCASSYGNMGKPATAREAGNSWRKPATAGGAGVGWGSRQRLGKLAPTVEVGIGSGSSHIVDAVSHIDGVSEYGRVLEYGVPRNRLSQNRLHWVFETLAVRSRQSLLFVCICCLHSVGDGAAHARQLEHSKTMSNRLK